MSNPDKESIASKVAHLFGLREGVGKFVSEVRDLDDDLKKLTEKLNWNKTAPRNFEDSMASLDQAIDDSAELFKGGLSYLKSQISKVEPNINPGGQAFLMTRPNIVVNTGAGAQLVIQQMICSLLGDELKAALRRELQKMNWSECGPPIREREQNIASLEREIQRKRADRDQLVNQANQLGVTIR